MAEALYFLGVSAHAIAAILRERLDYFVTMEAPTAGETGPTSYTLGGIQGRATSPEEFKALVEATLEPVVMSWGRRNIGAWFETNMAQYSHLGGQYLLLCSH